MKYYCAPGKFLAGQKKNKKTSLGAGRLGRKRFEGETTRILIRPVEMTPNRC